ncbi:POTRA domain-containing protein, partial [Stenoxybacter acetivorans]|uniref:POTRA domain-containing protein n=1 Tax=Stenoxybacter acetivorans TaxID=422441 RepID=UPI003CCBBDC9
MLSRTRSGFRRRRCRAFPFCTHRALRQLQFSPGSCLGRTGINQIMSAAQNAVIGAGYTTTRIL